MRTRLAATLSAFFTATAAQAHEGHGLQGLHWHATDVVGYLVLAAAAMLGWWLAGRK